MTGIELLVSPPSFFCWTSAKSVLTNPHKVNFRSRIQIFPLSTIHIYLVGLGLCFQLDAIFILLLPNESSAWGMSRSIPVINLNYRPVQLQYL